MKFNTLNLLLLVVGLNTLPFLTTGLAQSNRVVGRYKLVEKTVYDRKPVKLRKRIVETVYDEKTVYEWKPIYTTEVTEKRYRVQRPVQEQKTYVERVTLREPVIETSVREEEVRQTRMETVTEIQDRDFVVNKKVYKTEMREEKRIVRQPVVETEMRTQRYRQYKPVEVERDALVPSTAQVNSWVPVQDRSRLKWLQRGWYSDPVSGQTVFRRPGLHWVEPNPTLALQSQRIPVLTNQKIRTTELVPEDIEIQTPVTVRRMVEKVETRKIPVQVEETQQVIETRKVPVTYQKPVTTVTTRRVPIEKKTYRTREVLRHVPYTETTMRTEERVEPIRREVCRWERVAKTIRTPRQVVRYVYVDAIKNTPRTVTMRVPIDENGNVLEIPEQSEETNQTAEDSQPLDVEEFPSKSLNETAGKVQKNSVLESKTIKPTPVPEDAGPTPAKNLAPLKTTKGPSDVKLAKPQTPPVETPMLQDR